MPLGINVHTIIDLAVSTATLLDYFVSGLVSFSIDHRGGSLLAGLAFFFYLILALICMMAAV
jgi:hypothetical protein